MDTGVVCEQIIADAVGSPGGIHALHAQCTTAIKCAPSARAQTSRLLVQAKLASVVRGDGEIEWRAHVDGGTWQPARCPHGPMCDASCAVGDPARHDFTVLAALTRRQVPPDCIKLIYHMWRPHRRGTPCTASDFNVGGGPAVLLRCRAAKLPWARLAALPGSSPHIAAAFSVDIVAFLPPPALAAQMVALLSVSPGVGACDFISAMCRAHIFWNVVLQQQGKRCLHTRGDPGSSAGGGLMPHGSEPMPTPRFKATMCAHALEAAAFWAAAAQQVFDECWDRSEALIASSEGCAVVWSWGAAHEPPAWGWAAHWESLVIKRLRNQGFRILNK
jgi:hypothetical protein